MEKITLPSGGWVTFKDPENLTYGDREPIEEAGARADQKDPGTWLRFGNVLLATLIDEWSFTAPVPSGDPAGLRPIPARDVDAMRTRVLDLSKTLFLDTEDGIAPGSTFQGA